MVYMKKIERFQRHIDRKIQSAVRNGKHFIKVEPRPFHRDDEDFLHILMRVEYNNYCVKEFKSNGKPVFIIEWR